jgi:hypothetical protein
MISYAQLSDSIQEIWCTTAQEIVAVAIFGVSFFFWKYVQNALKVKRQFSRGDAAKKSS